MSAKFLGRTLHLLPSGRLVAKVESAPPIGSIVYDRMLKPVGRVEDVFGPVNDPYIQIRMERSRTGMGLDAMDIFTR
jgi:rRNA processing protein Gar1